MPTTTYTPADAAQALLLTVEGFTGDLRTDLQTIQRSTDPAALALAAAAQHHLDHLLLAARQLATGATT